MPVAKAVYVTSMEPASGKSMISLGLMEAFSRHTARVGYFRPVVASPGSDDTTIDPINRRYGLNQTTSSPSGSPPTRPGEVGSLHDADGLISEIMGKFDSPGRRLRCRAGRGHGLSTGASAAFEFELNVTMALEPGAPVLLVISAHHHRPDQVRVRCTPPASRCRSAR